MLSKVGTVLGYVLVGIVYFGFFGLPIVGLFAINHIAFIEGSDLSVDLGVLIVKSFVVKALLAALDVVFLINLIAYSKVGYKFLMSKLKGGQKNIE